MILMYEHKITTLIIEHLLISIFNQFVVLLVCVCISFLFLFFCWGVGGGGEGYCVSFEVLFVWVGCC